MKKTYEVAKFNKRTDKRIPVQLFSGLSQAEVRQQADKLTADLSPEQREEIEFRCCQGNPAYRFSMGSTRRP